MIDPEQSEESPAVAIARERMKRVREYVVRRLRDEVRGQHGAQAKLAREFGMSGAHLSNVLSDAPSRAPGEEFVHLAALHWGLTYAELEALAGSGVAPPAKSSTVVCVDAVDDDEPGSSATGTS